MSHLFLVLWEFFFSLHSWSDCRSEQGPELLSVRRQANKKQFLRNAFLILLNVTSRGYDGKKTASQKFEHIQINVTPYLLQGILEETIKV